MLANSTGMIVMVPNLTNRVVILTDVRHGGQISRDGGQINKNANITWQNYNTWRGGTVNGGMLVQAGNYGPEDLNKGGYEVGEIPSR